MTSEQATERKKPWRGLVEIGLFVALLLAFAWFQQRDMLLADGSVTIPEHQFVSLEGQTLPLLAADKPTLVYFFAPWCKVCRWSINNVDELDQSKVNVVKVALSYSNLEAVAQFVQETQTQRDNVLFGTRRTAHEFQVSAFPSVYIIEPDGRVVGRSVGYTTEFGLKLKLAFGV